MMKRKENSQGTGPKNPWRGEDRSSGNFGGRGRKDEGRRERRSLRRIREHGLARRCGAAAGTKGEKRKFVNKNDGEQTMKASKDATAKTLEAVAKMDKNHEHSLGMQDGIETIADLTALEKKGLDRKTNHQELM